MQHEEIIFLYAKHLKREPNNLEIQAHIHKNYSDFDKELETCLEKNGLQLSETVKNKKIAFLLCGHIRNAKILEFIKNTNENIDVFIFTWENIGFRGKIQYYKNGEDIDLCKQDIENYILQTPNLRDYKIENNQEYMKNTMPSMQSKKYFNHSLPEIFIKSQLHTIQQCYALFENYCNLHNVTYDVVFKSRFDCEIKKFNITQKMINYINQEKTIFVTNDGVHTHPFFSNGCMLCNRLYDSNFSETHIDNHTNIICDFFAYASPNCMKKYCNMLDEYDKINEDFYLENMERLKTDKFRVSYNPNSVRTHHLDSIFYFKCSYPERILQYYLKDYILVSSRDVTVLWSGLQTTPYKTK